MNLLRKKIVDLEESSFGQSKSEFKNEYSNQLMQNKKQKIKIEHLNAEFNRIKEENVKLKAEMLDTNNLSGLLENKDMQIKELNIKIKQFVHQTDKQLIQISELNEQIDNLKSELESTKKSTDDVINSLSRELRSLKINLNKTETREKEVLFNSILIVNKIILYNLFLI